MSSKLRIKIGAVEVDCEGSEEFLKSELPQILDKVVELYSQFGDEEGATTPVAGGGALVQGDTQRNGRFSTSTAASKLQAKSGGDLALAAAAAICIGEGKESFSRADLLTAMRSAKAHYKKTFRSNLSAYLSTLIKSGDILDHGGDNYGLGDAKRQELGKTLV